MADGDKNWKIRFYCRARGESPPKLYLLDLPNDDRAAANRYVALLHEVGTRIGMPYSKQLTGTDLRELRPKGHRFIYCLLPGCCFVILHAFPKKSNNTKKKDIDLALRRMSEEKGRLGI